MDPRAILSKPLPGLKPRHPFKWGNVRWMLSPKIDIVRNKLGRPIRVRHAVPVSRSKCYKAKYGQSRRAKKCAS